MTRVKDLQADNIDLIQSSEQVDEFLQTVGYCNDDYEYLFVVWDKARSGTVKEVYGSHSPSLEAQAYQCEEIK